MKSIHKLLVELSSEVRRFVYDLRLLITIGFKSDYKLLEHDYKILNIGNIKCQVDLLVIRGRECLWEKNTLMTITSRNWERKWKSVRTDL